jgi:RND family efflux transporter MFP subunit
VFLWLDQAVGGILMTSAYLRRNWLWLVSLTIVGAGWLIFGRGRVYGSGADAAASESSAPLVTVAIAQTHDFPIRFASQGHLVPLNQVEIRSQVTGIIRSVQFREGEDVKAGQLLFTLDDSDAKAQFNRVQAQVAQMKAQLDDANRDYERSKELVKQHFVSPSVLETSASKLEALRAQYRAAQAEVESVRIAVDRTRIVAPISAKAGAVNVHPGSLALQGDTSALVTLIQFDPICVEFTLPEQNLSTVLAARATGSIGVSVRTEAGQTIAGQLIFINNTVDSGTGTISLKASFPNAKEALWPGGFVRVEILAGYYSNAIVLPPQAVLEGPRGHFVYLLGDDGRVTDRQVTLLRIQDESAMVGGLSGGERVVVEGNQNLRAGMTVRIVGAASGTAATAG